MGKEMDELVCKMDSPGDFSILSSLQQSEEGLIPPFWVPPVTNGHGRAHDSLVLTADKFLSGKHTENVTYSNSLTNPANSQGGLHFTHQSPWKTASLHDLLRGSLV